MSAKRGRQQKDGSATNIFDKVPKRPRINYNSTRKTWYIWATVYSQKGVSGKQVKKGPFKSQALAEADIDGVWQELRGVSSKQNRLLKSVPQLNCAETKKLKKLRKGQNISRLEFKELFAGGANTASVERFTRAIVRAASRKTVSRDDQKWNCYIRKRKLVLEYTLDRYKIAIEALTKATLTGTATIFLDEPDNPQQEMVAVDNKQIGFSAKQTTRVHVQCNTVADLMRRIVNRYELSFLGCGIEFSWGKSKLTFR